MTTWVLFVVPGAGGDELELRFSLRFFLLLPFCVMVLSCRSTMEDFDLTHFLHTNCSPTHLSVEYNSYPPYDDDIYIYIDSRPNQFQLLLLFVNRLFS